MSGPGEQDDRDRSAEAKLEALVSAETEEWAGPDGPGEVPPAAGRARRRIRFPLWARFLTAGFVIVGSVGTATAASLILILSSFEPDPLPLPPLPEATDGAQTILILGSDKRPEDKGDTFRGLSDTTMLLRLDANRDAISLLSLPRDLRVAIPGHGTDKLNAAYAEGGPALTVKTVKQLTGLDINHVVDVDFEGFARAVNAIDCVYVDVDRRYFHSNDETADDYEEIDLQPGYQALCGFNALDYARYRHTDNDVVRAARQQDFLRAARQKVPAERLFSDRKELIDIFVDHTASDIDNAQEMLQVLKLFLGVRDAPVDQIHFQGAVGPSFVTASSAQIDRAADEFMGTEAPREPTAARGPAADAGRGAGEPARADDASDLASSAYGRGLARGLDARGTKLPVYYPTVLETGTDYAQKPRVYKINGSGDDSPPDGERAAYKWVFSRPALGEYYGFMATRWKNPPVLSDPTDEREIGGRSYKLFYDEGRLRLVAWQTDDGSFWVSNTLNQSLSPREMLGIARGMTELPGRG